MLSQLLAAPIENTVFIFSISVQCCSYAEMFWSGKYFCVLRASLDRGEMETYIVSVLFFIILHRHSSFVSMDMGKIMKIQDRNVTMIKFNYKISVSLNCYCEKAVIKCHLPTIVFQKAVTFYCILFLMIHMLLDQSFFQCVKMSQILLYNILFKIFFLKSNGIITKCNKFHYKQCTYVGEWVQLPCIKIVQGCSLAADGSSLISQLYLFFKWNIYFGPQSYIVIHRR